MYDLITKLILFILGATSLGLEPVFTTAFVLVFFMCDTAASCACCMLSFVFVALVSICEAKPHRIQSQ
jgi:hypothetical protein